MTQSDADRVQQDMTGQGGRRSQGEPLVVVLTWFAMAAIATNAVLIQTIVTDEASPFKNVVRGAVFAIAVFALVIVDARIPKWLIAPTVLSAVLLMVRSNPDQLSFLFAVALVPLLCAIPERTATRILVFSAALSLVLIFFILAIGITQNTTLTFRDRATYGTKGVPFFFNVVFGAAAMIVVYAWKYRVRARLAITGATLVVATYLFAETDARGGYAAFLILLIGLVIVPRVAQFAPARWAIASIPMLSIALAFAIADLWDNASANQLLSNRPFLLGTFLDHVTLTDIVVSSSVKRFDQVVNYVGSVDNSYLHLLIGTGVGVTALYCVAFAYAIANLFAEHRHVDIAFLIAASAYFNSESILLRIENIFVIYTWFLVLHNAAPQSWSGARANDGLSQRPIARVT